LKCSTKALLSALPYGVEGFATPKHLVKEDGTRQAQRETPLQGYRIQQGRKRIILSHSRIFEDAEETINNNIEKTTLGDIQELADLKEKLTQSEEKKVAKKAPAKKAVKKEVEKAAEEPAEKPAEAPVEKPAEEATDKAADEEAK
jgi:small subunit ribosomal protein S1